MEWKFSPHPKPHSPRALPGDLEPCPLMPFCFSTSSSYTVSRRHNCFAHFFIWHRRPDYGPFKYMHGPKTCSYFASYCRKELCKCDPLGRWGEMNIMIDPRSSTKSKVVLFLLWSGRDAVWEGLVLLPLVALIMKQVTSLTMLVASRAGGREGMDSPLPFFYCRGRSRF